VDAELVAGCIRGWRMILVCFHSPSWQ
jgi:hypothetical protein